MMRRIVDVLMAAGFSDAHDVMQFLGFARAARHPFRQLGALLLCCLTTTASQEARDYLPRPNRASFIRRQ